jgi:hypothetical protein
MDGGKNTGQGSLDQVKRMIRYAVIILFFLFFLFHNAVMCLCVRARGREDTNFVCCLA